jgi:transposase
VLYSEIGPPSIPEKLLLTLLLRALYLIRSERQLMAQMDFDLLFRWFVGPDPPVWVPTVFSKKRDRMLEGDIREELPAQRRGTHEPPGPGHNGTRDFHKETR